MSDFLKKPGPNFIGFKKNYDPRIRAFKEPEEESISELRIKVQETMSVFSSSGGKAHKAGVDKLNELGFDPLEELIKQLQEIEEAITTEASSPTPRLSYLQSLHQLKNKILEAILPYKYGKAPLVTVNDVDREEPIKIILTRE